MAIGLVPYLPILNIIFESVSPALCIVADYMLADTRPFYKILWRIGSVLIAVLNRCTEAVKNLCSRFERISDIFIGWSENVIFGIIFIGIKILKNSMHVYGMLAAV